VVDPAKDDLLVSATTLIPQTWQYEAISFGVGRPELVATHPDYRRRGLVRAVLDALHERSRASGHLLQVIYGIEHFYRQFGYSMALDITSALQVPLASAAPLKEGTLPRYTLRTAAEDDLPAIASWTNDYARALLISVARTHDEWRYEMFGISSGHSYHKQYFIILDTDGRGVGYVALRSMTFSGALFVTSYVVGDDASYLDTFSDVMRELRQITLDFRDAAGGGAPPHLALFQSGLHPTLDTLIKRQLGGALRDNRYAWYVRIADLPAFMRRVASVMETRLHGSGAHNWTGTLTVGLFARERLALQFERGSLSDARMEPETGENDCDFPYQMFVNVVLGHHNVSEIRAILPDTSFNGRSEALLGILFPKGRSWIVAQA